MYAKCPTQGYTLIECLKYQIEHHKIPNDDSFNPLGYCELQENKELSTAQKDELTEHAYKVGNPILFKKAEQTIPFTDYSLNFLWIHKDKMTESGHLMGSNDKSFIINVLNPVKDWQAQQPEARINFWIDSAMIDNLDAVIQRSKEILAKNDTDLTYFRFRDIRDIGIVKEYENLFLSSIPVYFRVDLAKAIIADYVIKNDGINYAINIDNDITAITRNHLFDQKTLNELHNIGYAFGTASAAEEENSFIMLYNNPNTINNHFNLVIKSAIDEANNKLAKEYPIGAQDVFYKYKNFKSAVRIAYRQITNIKWKNQVYESFGKYMIFPSTQFLGLSTYKPEEMPALKKALLTNDGCQ